jgi:hypothetical protein
MKQAVSTLFALFIGIVLGLALSGHIHVEHSRHLLTGLYEYGSEVDKENDKRLRHSTVHVHGEV